MELVRKVYATMGYNFNGWGKLALENNLLNYTSDTQGNVLLTLWGNLDISSRSNLSLDIKGSEIYIFYSKDNENLSGKYIKIYSSGSIYVKEYVKPYNKDEVLLAINDFNKR